MPETLNSTDRSTVVDHAPELGPVAALSHGAVVAAVEQAARIFGEYPDDVETAVRKVCAGINGLVASGTICRILFHCALLDGTPLRARFVADLLSSNGLPGLARLLVDHAISTGAKPWQRRRLEALKDAETDDENIAGSRQRLKLLITTDGLINLEPPDDDDSDGDWLSNLVRRLDSAPRGIHHDVLRVEMTAADASMQSLRHILEMVTVLPVVPVIAADCLSSAMTICDTLDSPLLERSRTIVLAPNRTLEQVIISIRGSELIDSGPTSDLVLRSAAEVDALAAGLGLIEVFSSPALRQHPRQVVEAFRLEASQLLPLSSSGRAVRRVLRFFGTRRQTAPIRTPLTGHLLATGFYDEALGLIDIALPDEHGKVYRSRRIRALFGTGRFTELTDTVDIDSASTADRHLVSEAVAASVMLEELSGLPDKVRTPFTPVPGSVLTILHASVPDQSGGYAVRAHSVLQTIVDQGYRACGLTRPGFPEGTNTLEPGETNGSVHDGLRYLRMGTEAARSSGEFAYMRESIDHYEQVIRQEKPSVVHLRSTYVSALPGLIAAKRLGVPVVYEVSGMWELVYEAANTARMEGRRARTVRLENSVLEHADAVVTITESMREIIDARVETKHPIDIMPNAVDTAEFTDRPKDPNVLDQLGWDPNVPVIGYIGSFVGYEGLDVLVRAVARIRRQGTDVRALLVGDGAEAERIHRLAVELGLDETAVVFTGRVPHDEVGELYSVIDVCVYPRLLTPATRAVSPLKPFEAMASRKSVIVSDVPALAEIAGHGERGLVVASGDHDALAEAICDVISDSERAQRMASVAADWVERERSWSVVGNVMGAVLDRLST